MYPDQPQTPNQNYTYPVDYLNEIAPQAPKRRTGGPNIKFILLLLGGALVLTLAVALIGAVTARPNTTHQLASRLEQTAIISKDAHKNIKSSSLRAVNSNLNLLLANTNRDLTAQLEASGIEPKKLDADVVAAEKKEASDLSAKLEDARLNATFDRTYSREMAYRLETILAYLSAAYENSSSESYREFLKSTYDNLEPIQKQIAQFNEDGS